MKLATPFQPPVAATVCKSISGTWNKTEQNSCGQNISVGSISLQDECWCFIFHYMEKVLSFNIWRKCPPSSWSTTYLLGQGSAWVQLLKKNVFSIRDCVDWFSPLFYLGWTSRKIVFSILECAPPHPCFTSFPAESSFPFLCALMINLEEWL